MADNNDFNLMEELAKLEINGKYAKGSINDMLDSAVDLGKITKDVAETTLGLITANPAMFGKGVKDGLKDVAKSAGEDIKMNIDAEKAEHDANKQLFMPTGADKEPEYTQPQDVPKSFMTEEQRQNSSDYRRRKRNSERRTTLPKGRIPDSFNEVKFALDALSVDGQYADTVVSFIERAYSVKRKGTSPAQNIADVSEYLLESGLLNEGAWVYASEGEGESKGLSKAVGLVLKALAILGADQETVDDWVAQQEEKHEI